MSVTFSLIIPVLHEASAIREAVARIRMLEGGETVEIIVVDGDPEGETLCALPDGAVRKILSEPGRGRQLSLGAETASGEVLIFLHADTTLPREAFGRIGEALGDDTLAGGAFDLEIDSPRPIYRLIERVASRRSRITRIPYGDQAIFLRRSCFQALGGFRDLPVMEDVDLMRRLRRSGRRIVILPERVVTSARRWEKEGALYTTLRNWLLRALFSFGIDVNILARWYRPHRSRD
jgi:rSAM/selenodomain-associated transferase 2